MPFQIRRGSTSSRLSITPLPGELIYDTTTGQIFVGDGATVGGVITTGISLEDARDQAASLFSSGVHSGVSFAYNDTANKIDTVVSTQYIRDAAATMITSGAHSGITFNYNSALDKIDATVTVQSIGPFDGDLTGSVFADDSTLLVDGVNGRIVGPVFANVTGNIVGVVTGTAGSTLIGNASTATQLQTARNINGVSFDGSADITIQDNTKLPLAGGTMTGAISFSGGQTWPTFNQNTTGNASTATLATNIINQANSATITASSSNVPNNIVTRDASGNFSATTITADLTGNTQGYHAGNQKGSVFADDSTLLVDAVNGRIVGPLATSGLVSALNTNGFSITSNNNQNIRIIPQGAGQVSIGKDMLFDFNTYLELGSTDPVLQPQTLAITQIHNLSNNCSNVNFRRARGTPNQLSSVVENDRIIDIVAIAWDGTAYRNVAAILPTVDGPVSPGIVPGRIDFATTNGSGIIVNRFTMKNDGVFQVDRIVGKTGTLTLDAELTGSVFSVDSTLLVDGINGRITGPVYSDVTGSVFSHDSTVIVDANDNKVTSNSVIATTVLQLPVITDDIMRSTAIPTPLKGMVIFIETGISPVATNQAQVYNGSAWVNM